MATMNTPNLPAHGFGEFDVPEMPAYVQSHSKRGNTFSAESTPVYSQVRWGNRRGRGGMGAYLSQLEDPTYFEGYRVKRGDQGVFPFIRWAPGWDWRGNGGIASLSETKNYAGISTRGGQLRKGGPKRSDIVERPNFFFENLRPGVSVGRYTQSNDNYAGLFDWKRKTPTIMTDSDPFILKQMIENNPFHISSHSAAQAKSAYDSEFGPGAFAHNPAYRTNLPPGYVAPNRTITERDPKYLGRP